MNKILKRIKRLLKDETGMESVPFVIVLIIAVMLLPFLMKLFD